MLIVDAPLVPTRDLTLAEQSENCRYSTNHQAVIDAAPLITTGQVPAGTGPRPQRGAGGGWGV
ncbi:hypothetical protein GCM10010425_21970 [Streptomyces spororaveus]|uniref:Uncharacterized protein n=1 Tax=Streptomyces spororaveus TaxID=284039 RepID=A0ABQ3TQE3_9ACTN|nr:hypothetical protein Sspor_81640 [Streptomyces spororaveus]